MPLRGKQPHERVCLQTGGARCAPPSARPAALPLLQLCLLCAGAGFICPGHVSFDADFSFCSVGRGLDPSAELPKNACRGEHCSPVPVCLARKPSRKMRCGGKLAGDQWSPLHTQQGKTRPSPPLQKNVGADSISARARWRQDKPPRAHIECAPTDYVSDKGRKLRAGHRLCEGNAPLRISFSTSALPVLGDTTKKSL